ncbi:MAG: trypsin-like serine protease [Actinobacteria bacterium]|nr:trypsin-like serine protease [Actinomycetota bacterium]
MRNVLLTAVAAVSVLVLAVAAHAITNGGPDGTGHPEVGAMLAPHAYSDGTWEVCTGTLISPTVFLTAAHCEGDGQVSVTFDPSYNAETGKTYTGKWHADPAYNKSQSDPHDLAVIVFTQPVTGITPARLPKLGQLDSLKHGDGITSVGYGAQSVTMGAGGATFHYADIRYVATGSVNALTSTWIRASMNPSTGDGGTCYGDSGGPNFLGAGLTETNIVAGTTITGDFVCRATNVDYRLDTASARGFLGQYVALP